MKKLWSVKIVGLFFVVLFLGGCYSRGHYRFSGQPQVTINTGQQSSRSLKSHQQLVSEQIAVEIKRVKKIIDMDDPKLNPRVLTAYKKAHAELDEMFIKAQICEAENLVALKHNVLSNKDCSTDRFVESPNYSNYGPALNPRQARGDRNNINGDRDINVTVNNNKHGNGDCVYLGRRGQRAYGYRRYHRLWGWQCHYGGYVDLSSSTGHHPY